MKNKKYLIIDHCTGEYRGAADSICNLKYIVPKKILIPNHNGSNYEYHFIIKQLAEEFEKQFTWKHGKILNSFNRKRNYKNW